MQLLRKVGWPGAGFSLFFLTQFWSKATYLHNPQLVLKHRQPNLRHGERENACRACCCPTTGQRIFMWHNDNFVYWHQIQRVKLLQTFQLFLASCSLDCLLVFACLQPFATHCSRVISIITALFYGDLQWELRIQKLLVLCLLLIGGWWVTRIMDQTILKSEFIKQKDQIVINKRNNLHNMTHLNTLKIVSKVLCFSLLQKGNKNTLNLSKVMCSMWALYIFTYSLY